MTDDERVYIPWKDWADLKGGIVQVIQDEFKLLAGRVNQLEDLHRDCRAEMEPIAKEHRFVKKILWTILAGNGVVTSGGIAAILKNPDILKEILKLF